MTTSIKISELELALEHAADPESELRRVLSPYDIGRDTPIVVVKRAIDARKRPPRHIYSVAAELEDSHAERLLRRKEVTHHRPLRYHPLRLRGAAAGSRPVVIGAGPAGLFAAHTLALAGARPILLERGQPVEKRSRDVSKLYSSGVLQDDSNVCYGEGGAGTYSDGKLYTRVGDPRVRRIMELLVENGAKPDILFVNRPHIGTDKLVKILRALRAQLVELGAEIHFGTKVEHIEIVAGAVRGVRTGSGERIECNRVLLATGHSAREVWYDLHDSGLPLECRPFAVGFRVEHPQTLIDHARYGQASVKGLLPAADYSLTYNEGDGTSRRGVWSFCMCPGGVVVTTPTHAGELCINGMSHASRSGRFANSALVVGVTPEDYAREGFTGTFAGVDYQLAAERRAFEAGGGAFSAPATRVSDFVRGRGSSTVPASSYRRGLNSGDLSVVYPRNVSETLKRALARFDHKIRGFVTEDAVLIGAETRTASPIRVPRSEDGQALGADGLYPAGEGMGYGGGIVSAAVDGMRAAEHLLLALGAETDAGTHDPVDQTL